MEGRRVRVILIILVVIIVALFGASFYMNYETIKLIENETVVVDNLIRQKDAVIEKLNGLVEEKQKELDAVKTELESVKKWQEIK